MAPRPEALHSALQWTTTTAPDGPSRTISSPASRDVVASYRIGHHDEKETLSFISPRERRVANE